MSGSLSASRAGWLVNRLRLMGPAEVLWRAGQTVQRRAGRWGVGMVHQPPRPESLAFGRPFLQATAEGFEAASVRAAADRVLAGRWRVFALEADLGFPPDWMRDPKTGTVAPRAFGKGIDYRDERVVGDIKYLWEPSRHLELTTLAQAWRLTGDDRYLEGARTLIVSWLDQCPYPLGVHWTSSLELAVRLLNWSATWQLFGGPHGALFSGPDGARLRERWLGAIFQHAHFIRGHLSRYSSANNHLFGEYLGLYIAGTTWPCWAQMRAWRDFGRRGLEAEALRQNSADGVNLEQAVYYQHEVMDMMLLALLAARAQGQDFSAPYRERLERLAEFLHAIMDAGGHVPMLGDADDALMLRLSHEPDWDPYRSLLAACALLFGRADFKHKAGRLDDKTRWLFGPDAQARWDTLRARRSSPRLAFPAGGHYLLGTEFDTPREVRIAIDCAPLGYLSIAAHGHADALAFTLSVAGRELLIDPGTYAYHTQKPWRDYFRGTLAHNTVRIDGQDQSVNGGNFMWLHKARARCVAHEPLASLQRFVGEHDGYRRLSDPVVHRREIVFDKANWQLIVTDQVHAHAPHAVEIAWHWSEQAQVWCDGSGVRASSGPAQVRMWCENEGFTPTLHRGDTDPILGWVARRFDCREPTAATVWRGQIAGAATIVTRLAIDMPARTLDDRQDSHGGPQP